MEGLRGRVSERGAASYSSQGRGVVRRCGQCSICALRYGASGIVLKETATRLLRKSIDTVMAGQYWIEREGVSDSAHVLAKGPRVVSREGSK